MADYADLRLDPVGYNAAVSAYEDPADMYGAGAEDDDEEEIEEEMSGFAAGFVAHRTKAEWEQLVASIPAQPSLSLQGNYSYEKQDSKHRMGDMLAGCVEAYKNSGSMLSMYEWLDAMPDWDRLMLIKDITSHGTAWMRLNGKYAAPPTDLFKPISMKNDVAFKAIAARTSPDIDKRGNLSPSMVKAFMKGVAYLDQDGRKSYRVKFRGGTAMQNDKEFTTVDMKTVFSGDGFGIWVMNDKGKMYSGSHVKGMMHHSSFLAGGDVMCGGEVYAANGKIRFLSAKTGHYQASMHNLMWVLNVLRVSVSNFDEINVLAWSGDNAMMVPASKLAFSHYDAWGKLTPEQNGWLRGKQFMKFQCPR